MKSALFILTTILTISLAGCSTNAPELSSETREDGLAQVKNSSLDISFVKPDVDWTKYETIHFAKIKADNEHPSDYRKPRKSISDGLRASYDLNQEDLDKLTSEFKRMTERVFNEEQPWQLVDKTDKNTLVVEVLITDVRMTAAKEKTRRASAYSGGRTYTQNSGSMVLIAQLKDGESGEILGQAIDRGTTIDQWQMNTAVFNLGDVRTIYRNWLNTLNNGLISANAKLTTD